MSEQDKRTIEEAFASGGQDALNKEIENIRKNNEDSSETNKNAQKTLADIQKEDLERLNRETEREFERNHDGMPNYAVAGGTAAIAAMAGYMGNRSNRDNSSVTPTTGLTPEEEQRRRREEAGKRIENKQRAMDSANSKYEQRQNEIRQRYAQEEARVRNDVNSTYTTNAKNPNGKIILGQSAINDEIQRRLKDANAQMTKDLDEAKENYNKQKQSITRQYASQAPSSSSTSSAAENAAKQSWAKGKLANIKNVAKASGPASLGLSAVMAGAEEFMDWQENPDKFSTGERFARFGITAGTEAAGMVVGGALGSLLGPVGTIAGGMAGAYGGRMLGDAMKKYFKISDEDGKRMGDSYLDASKWASGKYTDDTNSLINSNDKTAQVTKEKMEEHGVKMESLTKDQQIYIDKLFNELKALGYSDISAGAIVGTQAAEIHNKELEDTYQDKSKSIAALKEGLSKNTEHAGHYRTALRVLDDSDKEFGSVDKVSKANLKDIALIEKDLDWSTKDAERVKENKTQLKDFLSKRFTGKEGKPIDDKFVDDAYKFVSALHESRVKHGDQYADNIVGALSNDMSIGNFSAANQEKFSVDRGPGADYGNISIGDAANNLYMTGAQYAEDTASAWRYHAAEHYPQSKLKEAGDKAEQEGKPREKGIEEAIKPEAKDIKEKDPRIAKGGHAVVDWDKGYEITAPFGDNEGVHAGRGHKGIDIGNTQYGGNIYASGDFKSVELVPESQSGGYGNLAIGHMENGMQVYYGHMQNFAEGLENGQAVSAGTILGNIGSTGRSTGPHVHFEVRNEQGDVIDPTEYAKYGILPDGSIGDGRAPVSSASNLPEGGSTPSSSTSSGDLKNNPESMESLATKGIGAYKDQLKNLGLTSSDAFRDKYAAGRLIMDGTTASFRDRDVYMTPQGLRNRLALSSGARETSLMGYNTKGYFSWDEKSKTYKQFDTSGVKMEDKRLKDLEDKFYKGKKGEITYLDGAKEKIDYQNKAVTDTTAWQQESAKRYETPVNERLEQDTKNDMDEKHSVNISMNVIGGGVTKQQVIQFIRNTLIDKEEQDSQHYRRAANEASLQQHEREKRISGHE